MRPSYLTRLLVLFVLLALAVFAIAAPPQTINYQGYLKNTDGTPVNADTSLTFSIYSSTSGAGAVWSEQKSVGVSNGIFSTRLGTVTPLTLGFGRQLYLGVRAESDPEMRPLQPLASVPSAYRAAVAESALSASTVTSPGAISGSALASLDQRYTPATFTNSSSAARIATLRWGQPIQKGATFAVGAYPSGIAFDGANIWVANQSGNTVSKLRMSDGALLGTYPVGSGPTGIAFDGATIWVANRFSNDIYKLRASDGTILGTYPVGVNPWGVVSDGTSIGVTAIGDNTITRLRASDGAILSTSPTPPSPFGIAYDGTYVWMTSLSGNNVWKILASTSELIGYYPVGNGPMAVAYDGASIWVVNSGSNTVSKLQASDGATLGTYNVGTYPVAITFDGANIWVANANSNNVTKLRASDGGTLGTYAVGTDPRALAFDGASIWVVNAGSSSVTRIPAENEAAFAAGSGAVMDKAVTTAKIADASVTAAKLDTAYVKLAGDTMTGQLNLPASGVKIGNSYGAITENWWEFGKNDGETGTGIDFHGGSTLTDFTARLHRVAGDNSEFQIVNYGTGPLSIYTGGYSPRLTILGNGNVGLGTNTPADKLEINGAGNLLFKATAEDTGDIIFQNSAGAQKARIFAMPETGAGLYLTSGDNTADIAIDSAGNVGIGTTAPGSRLTVGPTLIGTPLSSTFVSNAGALGTTAGNILNLANFGFTSYNHTSLGIKARRNSSGTDWQTSAIGLSFDVDSTSPVNNAQLWMTAAGNLGIGTATPTQKLDVRGNYIKVEGAGGEQAYFGGIAGYVRIGSMNSGVNNVTMINQATGQFMTLYLRDIQIMGGADLAEPFNSVDTNKLLPGMLVVIDTENPGHLILADKAYDKKVAGIVSGANGIRPGVTMGQEGTAASGTVPVALSGRVYAWADASYGAIEPGDLLATSDTPGHAMKVTDHTRAQGACIGKAMSRLSEGTGFVLVLVSLQ